MKMTKWGKVQHAEQLAEGVVVVSTSGHGGIVLSDAMNAHVPARMRCEDGCYEEDADWSIAWIALRRAGVLTDSVKSGGATASKVDETAEKYLLRWHPDFAEELLGKAPDPENPILLERKDYAEAREKSFFIAVSATASSAGNSVPKGMVGAIIAPPDALRDAPDRARDISVLIDAEIYEDSLLKSGMRIFCEEEIIRVPYDPWKAGEVDPLEPDEAYGIASQWGSFMSESDRGAVFYTFPFEEARPQNFEHRRSLVAYTRHCQLIAQERIRDFENASQESQGAWPWGNPYQDMEDLQRLETFFLQAEAMPEKSMEGPEL